jgi:hypothetical protein
VGLHESGACEWIGRGAFGIEALAVVLILGCIALATADWLY